MLARFLTGVMLAGLVVASPLLVSAQPAGKSMDGVQFDVTIDLDYSQSHNHTTLFARYWVSPVAYAVGVVWAEPNARGLDFPVYPPTLTIESDPLRFGIGSQIYPSNSATFTKPLGESGLFTNVFGSYALANLRYADQAALADRIYSGAGPAGMGPGGHAPRLVAGSGDSQADAIGVFRETNLLKLIDYKYVDTNKLELRREVVVLAPQPLKVGLPGKGVKVGLSNASYRFTNLVSAFEASGRICTVDYQSVPLGQTVVTLPQKIEVRDGATRELLRTARWQNFQPMKLTAEQAQEAADRFSAFSPEELAYRKFLVMYWQKAPGQVSAADALEIKNLRAGFETEAAGPTGAVGANIKRLGILMELDRMLGDEPDAELHFQTFLACLGTNGLTEALLSGGYGAIDTLVLWGRLGDADAFMKRWIEAANQFADTASVHRFAERELLRGDVWAVVKLLEGFTNNPTASDAARFETSAIKCFALEGTQRFFDPHRNASSHIINAQAAWVESSANLNQIAAMFTTCTNETKGLMEKTGNLTYEQANLKTRFEKLLKPAAGIAKRNEP